MLDREYLRVPADMVKMVNCAGCERELVGESMQDWWTGQKLSYRREFPLMRGRLAGRPYCAVCYNARVREAG